MDVGLAAYRLFLVGQAFAPPSARLLALRFEGCADGPWLSSDRDLFGGW